MTTPQDLFLVSLDVPGDHPVEPGDLSLALAGAELVDLLAARALALEGDRIVPGPLLTTGDRMLDEAGAALVRKEPYETVEDWLWRRGEGLATAYRDVLDAGGQLSGQRHRWPHRVDRAAAADTPARRHAADRWWSREPVLAQLAATLGVQGERRPEEEPGDEAVVTVLVAVGDAVTELTAVRERRRIENAAFDNIWRGPS